MYLGLFLFCKAALSEGQLELRESIISRRWIVAPTSLILDGTLVSQVIKVLQFIRAALGLYQ